MALLIAGAVLVALGLVAGALLVAAPLGAVAATADPALWVLFPLLSVAGFSLFVVGAKRTHIRGLSLALSCALLALAVGSALGLLLRAASLVHSEGSTVSLWYVLVVAGILGSVGAASRGSSADNT